jgi:hypothetical protein
VEVLSEQEIRSTLDHEGMFENVPFMPEMSRFCGKKFRVHKRADKICVEGAYTRRMEDAVTLENVRCDGSAHHGCARLCKIFWKEAWLRRASLQTAESFDVVVSRGHNGSVHFDPMSAQTFICQSTELHRATTNVSSMSIGQYLRDITSGNFRIGEMIQFLYIYLYNKIAYRIGKPEYKKPLGTLTSTPTVALDLQPGELVEVRSREEITQTLDREGRNRGLHTDWESLRHCGKRFRVLRRVDRMILEDSGNMRELKNTVILEGAECSGLLRRGCARNGYPFWREAWLRRIERGVEGSKPDSNGGTISCHVSSLFLLSTDWWEWTISAIFI